MKDEANIDNPSETEAVVGPTNNGAEGQVADQPNMANTDPLDKEAVVGPADVEAASITTLAPTSEHTVIATLHGSSRQESSSDPTKLIKQQTNRV